MRSKTAFQEHGVGHDAIFADLERMTADDLPSDGHAFAFAYDAGREVKAIAREAYARCMGGNGLDPTAYPSTRRLENDVVGAALSHLRAPDGAAGTATAGGTESVLLAVKTARDHARRTRPGITAPEMLVPETAHSCFHKGAQYFGVRLVPVAVDPVTLRASVDDLRAKINANTILLVGSAPGYAHGVIDPIAEMAGLAFDRGLLCHVDACIGGWVLPFERELGVDLPAFDFTLPGVTSMSVDLHKYAFAPKGISVLMHRTRTLRDAQYYACSRWSGYTVVNTTMLGSKSAGAMGAAWAVMRHLGRSGYRDLAGRMWSATQRLVRGINAIDGVHVVAAPSMGLLAVATDGGDLFELADRVTARGWHVQPTYAFGASPAHIHLCVDPGNAEHVDDFLVDLAACARDLPLTQTPPPQVVQMLEGMAARGDGAGPDTGTILRELGVIDGKLPAQQAMIHRLLNAVPPGTREALLVGFMGELFG